MPADVGDFHTCGAANGALACWGWGASGQLGDGLTTSSSVPVQVSGLAGGVQAVAAGHAHTCALVDGRVAC